MKQFTAPGGIATAFTFSLTFMPEYLIFDNTVPLTSLKVEDQGVGVILDLDTAGIAAVKNFGFQGTKANYVALILANGVILNRNVTISGVTSAAGAVPFFTSGDNKGDVMIRTSKATILANNPTMFEKFTAVFVPSFASGDRAIIDYASGFSQIFEKEELEQLSGHIQNVVTPVVNNLQSYIKKLTAICAAQNTAYVLSAIL